MAQQQATRRSSESNNRKPPTPGKQPVGEPASFKHFFLILLMHICRRMLLVRTPVKLAIYLFGTSALSLATDLLPIPRSYFSNKNNAFNEYFVKLGWGWTLSLMVPFIFYTSSTFCCRDKTLVRKHLSRMAVATGWWYICTSLFNWTENTTGMCDSGEMEHSSKNLCRKAGYQWKGFDISGHAFLLIHCLLVISEEAKCFKCWDKIADVIKSETDKETTRLNREQLSDLKFCYKTYTPRIKALIVATTLFQLLWEVMLVSTILYFHNMPQKLIASGFAGLGWLLTYQMWYPMDNWPVSPGKTIIRYQKGVGV